MKALRADLKLAGIQDIDAEGLFADLHGLGKSFITAMAANGVSQRAAMAIARHTDPRLTASVYTDEALLPLAAEIGKVPRLPSLESHAPVNVAAETSKGDGKGAISHRQCAATNGEGPTRGTGIARRSKSGSEDLQIPAKLANDDGPRAAPAQRNRDFARHSGALYGTNGKGEPPVRSGKGDDSQVSQLN